MLKEIEKALNIEFLESWPREGKNTYRTDQYDNIIGIGFYGLEIDDLSILNPIGEHLESVKFDHCLVKNIHKIGDFPRLKNLDLASVDASGFFEAKGCNRKNKPIGKIEKIELYDMTIHSISSLLQLSNDIKEIALVGSTITSIDEIYQFEYLDLLQLRYTNIGKNTVQLPDNQHFKLINCYIDYARNHPFDLETLLPIAAFVESIDFRDCPIYNWHYISRFTELKTLHFRYTQQFSLRNLVPLAKQITSLTLDWIEIDYIEDIAAFTQLEDLTIDIGNGTHLHTFKNLLPLADNLKKLWFATDEVVDDLDLIANFQQLEDLYLFLETVPKDTLHHLFSLDKLKKLQTRFKTTDVVTVNVKSLKSIEELNLDGDENISLIGFEELNNLKRLTLNDFSKVEGLEGNTSLIRLEVDHTVDINQIASIKSLRELIIVIGFDEKYKLKSLERFANLEKLRIGGEVGDEIALGQLNNLKILDLSGQQISAISKIDGLDKLVKLEELDLSCNNLTELSGLETLKNLKVLDLGENYSIKNIDGIANLKNLEILNLYENKIVDFRVLNKLDKLVKVNVAQNGIDKMDIKKQLDRPEIAYFIGLPRTLGISWH